MQLITAAADGSAALTERDEEAAVLLPLSSESLQDSRVAFLAGTAASSRRTHKVNPVNGPVLIDLTGALEDLPEARLRAPLAEPPRGDSKSVQPPRGNSKNAEPVAVHRDSRVQVIAHPAAIALAMFFGKLSQRTTIRRSLVHVFEPASERGKQGLDELQQQTVAVLSFKKLQ